MKDHRLVFAIAKLLSYALNGRDARQRFQRACREGLRCLQFTQDDLLETQEMVLATARLHQETFSAFKGCHQGREIVVVATGPSLDRFVPLPGAVYIGVNKAFRRQDIAFDYLFTQDYSVMCESLASFVDYRGESCVKFCGQARERNRDWFDMLIPEAAVKGPAVRRYRTWWWPSSADGVLNERFAYDLSTQLLASFHSIVFPALQFALWTNPRRIYLVGCDCSGVTHSANARSFDIGFDFGSLIRPYERLKAFAARYYPETEIVSVNPVGLKGLFKDVYQ